MVSLNFKKVELSVHGLTLESRTELVFGVARKHASFTFFVATEMSYF